MKGTLALSLTCLILFLCSCNQAGAESLPKGVTISHPTEYDINMETTVKIPKLRIPLRQVRCWHALPTLRPWSTRRSATDATLVTWNPKNGRAEPEPDKRSIHIYWEQNAQLLPGKEFKFNSHFVVKSYDRIFDPAMSSCAWKDYADQRVKGEKYTDPLEPELISFVSDSIKQTTPTKFVQDACKWIKDHIEYDGSAPWPAPDVRSTLKKRRGHCAHQVSVFKQMCAIAGIPYRPAFGMHLTDPNGIDPATKDRPDFNNNHTWAEVYFPNTGWIEVDVDSWENCYKIPKSYIENNTGLENYIVWITEVGKASRVPVWFVREGKWFNEYGIQHVITYKERPL